MSQSSPKIFLTGEPGCGKTTALRRVVEHLRATTPMTGFLTEEILEQGKRTGFRGVTLDGQTFSLAHTETESRFRVGRYGVELDGLESIGFAALTPSPKTRLVVLDEVGKMESFSARFRQVVEALLDGRVALLGTIALHGVGFVKRVRQDPRIALVRMSRRSRDNVVGELLRMLADGGVGLR